MVLESWFVWRDHNEETTPRTTSRVDAAMFTQSQSPSDETFLAPKGFI